MHSRIVVSGTFVFLFSSALLQGYAVRDINTAVTCKDAEAYYASTNITAPHIFTCNADGNFDNDSKAWDTTCSEDVLGNPLLFVALLLTTVHIAQEASRAIHAKLAVTGKTLVMEPYLRSAQDAGNWHKCTYDWFLFIHVITLFVTMAAGFQLRGELDSATSTCRIIRHKGGHMGISYVFAAVCYLGAVLMQLAHIFTWPAEGDVRLIENTDAKGISKKVVRMVLKKIGDADETTVSSKPSLSLPGGTTYIFCKLSCFLNFCFTLATLVMAGGALYQNFMDDEPSGVHQTVVVQVILLLGFCLFFITLHGLEITTESTGMRYLISPDNVLLLLICIFTLIDALRDESKNYSAAYYDVRSANSAGKAYTDHGMLAILFVAAVLFFFNLVGWGAGKTIGTQKIPLYGKSGRLHAPGTGLSGTNARPKSTDMQTLRLTHDGPDRKPSSLSFV